jgi:hypothetical protein
MTAQEMSSQYSGVTSDISKPPMRLTQTTNASPHILSTQIPEIPSTKGAYDSNTPFSSKSSINDSRMHSQRLPSAPFMQNSVPRSVNASGSFGGMTHKPSEVYMQSTIPSPAQDMRPLDRLSSASSYHTGNKEASLRDSLQSMAPYGQPPFTKQTDQPPLPTSTNYYSSNNGPPQVPYTR